MDSDRKKRIVLYCRVSTCQQRVEGQVLPLRQYAEARNFDVVEVVTDVGVSGRKNSRPGLDRVLALARRREVDAIMVWKLDRFFRNTRHLLNTMQELKHLGVAFVSYTEQIDCATPLGEALMTLVGALAQFEADLIRERVMMGLARARAEGRRLGRPTVGVPVERVVEEYQRSNSIRTTAKALHISPATVQRLLASAKASAAPIPTKVPVAV